MDEIWSFITANPVVFMYGMVGGLVMRWMLAGTLWSLFRKRIEEDYRCNDCVARQEGAGE